ncbi:MAG: TraX family protein [Clostridium sp.]
MLIIAYLTMILDHVEKFLYPNYVANPIMGRIAMPIFAYLIAFGMTKTKSKEKYILRLAIFALVSQIPYILMIKGFSLPPVWERLTDIQKIKYIFVYFTSDFNIGFPLLLGALSIKLFENTETTWKLGNIDKIIIGILSIFIAETLQFDGGAYTYLLILMFYYLKDKKINILIAFTLLTTIYITYVGMRKNNLQLYLIQYYSLLSLPIIFFVNNTRKIKINSIRVKKILKLLKYSIYPVHMLAIYILSTCVLI